MSPKMIRVAGPPGSGKSSLFPVWSFGVSYFNADDRAAELNGGPYVSISKEIRAVVIREFEEFVLACIARENELCHRNDAADYRDFSTGNTCKSGWIHDRDALPGIA